LGSAGVIKDYIRENAIQHSDKIFITINSKNLTYREFDNLIFSIEQLIHLQKIFPKRVKINCSDKSIFLASIIACNRVGAIPIIFPSSGNLIKFLDYNKIANSDFEINDNTCIMQPDENDYRQEIFNNPEDVQCILFTSGTGMNPKAVELTFSNNYNSALNWNEIVHFNSNDKYLNILPLWHISGLSIFFRSIYFNFQSIISNYNKVDFISLIQKLNINCISVVPKMINEIISLKDYNIFKNFKIIIIGGDRINKNIFNYFKKINERAYIAYGMTETSSGVAGYFLENVNSYEPGFLGFPHKNTIIDINEEHIEIKSKTVMKKYSNNEQCNGTILTDDLGILKNNKLFYKSRSSNFIISGGENINLDIIKNVIIGYNQNIKIKIIGMDDSKWGQVPAVFLEEAKYDIDEIKKHCEKYLPKYMIPKYFLDSSNMKKNKKI